MKSRKLAAIFVQCALFLALLKSAVCGLEAGETGLVKEFKLGLAQTSTSLVLEFKCDLERALYSTNVSLTFKKGVFQAPKHSSSFGTLVRDGSAFFVGRSSLPVGDGFMMNRGFCASAASPKMVWSLNPAGQIAYDLDALHAFTNHLQDSKQQEVGTLFPGYSDIDLVTSFCIDAERDSLVWRGNEFEAVENVHGAPHLVPRRLSGYITVSNGIPMLASYLVGTNLHVRVTYHYTNSAFDIPFPSLMQLDRFLVLSNGIEKLAISKVFNILQVRNTINDVERAYFEPTHWIYKPIDYSSLVPEDFIRMSSLASTLKAPKKSDLISLFVRDRLSTETMLLLANYGGGIDESLKAHLATDFNRIINGPLIYDPERFLGVTLSSNTVKLLNSEINPTRLPELNERLLLDCYKSELSKVARMPRETMFEGGQPVAARFLDGTWHSVRETQKSTPKMVFGTVLISFMLLPLFFWLRAHRAGLRK